MKKLVSVFAMIVSLLVVVSVAVAQQTTTQKPQAAKEMQKPPAKALSPAKIKLSDLKDTDIVEFQGRKMTVKEAKPLIRKRQEAAARQAQAKSAKTAEQRVQQLRAAEESSRRSHVQQVSQGLASEIQRPPDALCSQLYSDNKPHIRSVYPTTVNAGDPILIKGCGFLSQPGQATFLVNVRTAGPGGVGMTVPKTYTLNIKSWTDTAIQASIPEVTGFGSASLIVTSSQNIPSAGFGFTLTQWTDYQLLRDPSADSICSECSFGGGGNGSGTDQFLKNISLMNNWRVEKAELSCGYNEPTVDPGPLGIPIVNLFNDVPCNWPQYGAAMVGGTQPQAGDTQIKGISVQWKTKTTYAFEFVYYYGYVTVKGPKGTSPR
ncbi:MAG TPA: hypothetical protein VMB77_02030 [Syntrophales bacterium]|nr:hypothetical protein [Syntrophales bacterium]